MKTKVLVVILLFVTVSGVAQIPNPGFEQWSGGEPVGWFTSNIPGFGIPVTQSQTARSGSFALRGQVVSAFDVSWTPFIQSGTSGQGFPVTQRHAMLTGYYQFTPVGGDRLIITALMYHDDMGIGVGEITIENAASSYTLFSFPIEYLSPEVPNKCFIDILIGNSDTSDSVHVNSSMLIDDLAFSGIVSVAQNGEAIPGLFLLQQNFPNPFNPSTTIEFSLPNESFTSLKIFNNLGEVVATLVNESLRAGTHRATWNAEGLASGAYFCHLEVGGIVLSRKLLFLK